MKASFTLINSALKPSAQFTKLCKVGTTELFVLSDVIKAICDNRYISENEKFLLCILFRSGCRVSEVLNINGLDLLPSKKVLIKGLKGSENRILDIYDYIEVYEFYYNTKLYICGTTTRFRLYRILKNMGLHYIYSGNKKASTTHLGRHLFVSSLSNSNLDKKDISRLVGIKREKNLMYYEKQK